VFTDVNHSTWTYTAEESPSTTALTLISAPWLKFDATTRTFSGCPPNGTPTPYIVKLCAEDARTDKECGLFNIIVAADTNPVVAAQPDIGILPGVTWTYTVPATTFTDADGDALTYTAYTVFPVNINPLLTAWGTAGIAFNTGTLVLTGTPNDITDSGTTSIKVEATENMACA
jgi:hypothetical protein